MVDWDHPAMVSYLDRPKVDGRLMQLATSEKYGQMVQWLSENRDSWPDRDELSVFESMVGKLRLFFVRKEECVSNV